MAEPYAQEPESLETYIRVGEERLSDAVLAVTGSHEGDPLEVFQAPPQVRNQAPNPGYTPQQEADLREAVSYFGLGGVVDVPSAADWEIPEAGMPWKVRAEAAITNGNLIYAGSPNRNIGDKEKAFMTDKLPEGTAVGATEYDMVRQVATLDPEFVPLSDGQEDIVIPFSYTVIPGQKPQYPSGHEPSGQLKQIGTRRGEPVYLLQIDREYYQDDKDQTKYSQPDGAATMQLASDMLRAVRADEDSSIGLVTSSTYPSRAISAMRAGLRGDRRYSVGLYGRQTLADIQGLPDAEPTAINQIPGETYEVARALAMLKTELTEQQS